MQEIKAHWDSKKAKANLFKHGVAFEEAATAFSDPNGRLMYDPDHSRDEDRFVLLALSTRLRLIVVTHSYRKGDSEIRIISARKASRKEQDQYGSYDYL